jgi:uncharacterized protein (DUF488 family)
MRVFTLGYEGLKLPVFMGLLARHGIETVVDVRALPLSRKVGFSKQALRHELQLCGFGYAHIAALGCPKPIREDYGQHGDWARYTEGFMKHLAGQDAAIAELAALARVTTCALLCYEADPNYCHRSMVAEAVRKRSGAQIEHIVAKNEKDERNLPLF